MRQVTIALAILLIACSDDGGETTATCETACDTPPAAECVGDSALRSYASPGTCGDDGVCSYGHVDLACENGCSAGACLEPVDPCADVVCVDPPAARCDGDMLETFANLGTCEEGTCSYGSVRLPCDHGCENGACAGDPCNGVICNQPPTSCHAVTGTCSNGLCDYPVLVGATCDDGDACSENDRCSANATCAGSAIACQSPGAPTCSDDTLLVPDATGTCVAGQCEYGVSEVECPIGCSDGECEGDPCAGIVCDSPPSGCHAATGTCQNGVCAYDFDNGASCDDSDPCSEDDRCTNGICGGSEIACTTPPADSCKDGDTLIARGATGTCEGGTCSYVEIEVPCAFGCITVDGAGACDGDPCAGVVCETPPAATCANNTSLVVASDTGTCVGGSCIYDNVVFTCIHGCVDPDGDPEAFCKPPEGLVISEVLFDTDGFPDSDSFLEIWGPPGTALEGVTIVGINGNGGADYATIELEGTIASDGFFVVAHPDADSAITDVADMLDANVDLQNGPDSVQLRFGKIVLDALAYGTFGEGDVAAGEGTPVAAPEEGQTLGRDRDYSDTNDNATDFTPGDPTPAASNPPPDVQPDVVVSCPDVSLTGEVLTFDASESTGTIETYTFDFGDGSDATETTSATATHTYDEAGIFEVSVTAESPTGLTDSGTCEVWIEDPVVFEGDEQCFPSTNPPSYLYEVISNPVAPTEDGKLTVTFKGTSVNGPKPYVIELQVKADTWEKVAVTNDSKASYQTENFRIPKATLKDAIDNLGWIRFRFTYQENGADDNCVTLDFTYNCESCFACPEGQEDLGIGCRSVDAPYDYTALEHPTGQCGEASYDMLYLPGTPPATGSGTLSIEFLGCEDTTITVEIYTTNGWEEIGSEDGPNCGFGSGSWSIPEAFLDAAVDDDDQIRFRWQVDDSCAPGTGCAAYNDPCVRNARLTYPR